MTRPRLVQRRLIWWLAGLAAAAVPAGSAPAAHGQDVRIRAFRPVADAYVSSARPDRNFGRARVLLVDGEPETTAYLRFELKQIKGSITSVTLLVHPSTATRGRVAVRRVSDRSWRERRLTYDNAPRPSSRYAASQPMRRGAWSAIDITPFVDGGGEISLAITTRAARALSFGSRESRHGPRLVIRSDDDKLEDAPGLIAEALGLLP